MNFSQIHVQYEDMDTDPAHPFTIGVVVGSLKLTPCTRSAVWHLGFWCIDHRHAMLGRVAVASALREATRGSMCAPSLAVL